MTRTIASASVGTPSNPWRTILLVLLLSAATNIPRAWSEHRTQAPAPSGEPVGACCFSDCRCEALTRSECDAAGGNYQGSGLVCAPNPCSCPTGACCYPDGHCEIQNTLSCGGEFLGAGTTCQVNPCPQPNVGACCSASCDCIVLTQPICEANEGIYLGDGTNCVPNPCDCPLGACCYPDGLCLLDSESSCAAGGGEFVGGPYCDPNPGPQPSVGACCVRFGALCRQLTEAQCTQGRGVFRGAGASCSPNPCRPHTSEHGDGIGSSERRTWGEIKRQYR